jgi:hypothetical protein
MIKVAYILSYMYIMNSQCWEKCIQSRDRCVCVVWMRCACGVHAVCAVCGVCVRGGVRCVYGYTLTSRECKLETKE